MGKLAGARFMRIWQLESWSPALAAGCRKCEKIARKSFALWVISRLKGCDLAAGWPSLHIGSMGNTCADIFRGSPATNFTTWFYWVVSVEARLQYHKTDLCYQLSVFKGRVLKADLSIVLVIFSFLRFDRTVSFHRLEVVLLNKFYFRNITIQLQDCNWIIMIFLVQKVHSCVVGKFALYNHVCQDVEVSSCS